MQLSLWPSVFIILLAAGHTSADPPQYTTSPGTRPTTPGKAPTTPGAAPRTTRTRSTTPGTAPTAPTTSGTTPTSTASSRPPIPGVYPLASPNSPPPVNQPGLVPDFTLAWAQAYSEANTQIAALTLEQKVDITTGVGYEGGLCNGNIPAVASFPGLCLQGSSLGVRDADFVTAFPASINAASTWQRTLLRARGAAMGSEFAAKGVNIALSPMMNMGRVPQGGRNWECFGADPYLTSVSAYETILGLQSSGVQAAAGHFIDYEQETQRSQYSSNVDDRTQHEIYAAPFLRSVMAGVASVMCSYNLVNGAYACENNSTLNGILKSEFGFQGFVMSDWYATHSALDALNGLDMTMPGDMAVDSGTSYFGANLVTAVQNGSIPEARVDDMATRILAAWHFLGQTNYTKPSFNSSNLFDAATNQHINVQSNHGTLAQQIGASSIVLLKNNGSILPLNKPRRVAVIGSDAAPAHNYGPNEFPEQGGVDGILAMGWGSGSVKMTYLISPYEALQARARSDHTAFSWFFDDWDTVGAGAAAYFQDAAIVFVQADSGEGTITVGSNAGDRSNLTAWNNGDALVQAVAANSTNTIVVVNSVGPLILEPWIDNPNVRAVIWAGLGGTETGYALADVLYGNTNPSGRLPYTIAKSPNDYPAQLTDAAVIDYTEGLFIDYRHFDFANIAPRYEFGFGLSYTTFEYSAISVTAVTGQPDQDGLLEANWAASKPNPPVVGGSTALWLHRPMFDVTFNVKNTGKLQGTEIPQLYVQFPWNSGEPPNVLRGFTDITLQPGQMQTMTISISRYDLSIWDVPSQSWLRAAGTYSVAVGASSRDFRLNAQIPF